MKKRKGVRIKINFTNRWLYSLIAIGILVIISVGVYAWANSAGVGHSYDELQPCSGTQILKMNGAGAWACADDVGIGTETDPQVGTITTSGRYCTTDGSAIQCTTTRANTVYTINSNCANPGLLTTASTCFRMGAASGCTFYQTIPGVGSQYSCPNTAVGYLIN